MNKILEELYKSPAYKSLSPSYQAELQFFLLSALTEQIIEIREELGSMKHPDDENDTDEEKDAKKIYNYALAEFTVLLDKKLH